MIDLTNRVGELSVEEKLNLIHRYKNLIEFFVEKFDELKVLSLLVAIDISVNYIKDKYADIDIEWKQWSVVLIKKLYEDKFLLTDDDVTKHIDAFFEYKKEEYDKYLSDIGLYSSEYYRDLGFLLQYVNKLSL